MSTFTLKELEKVAAEVIRYLKDINEYSEGSIAVIGGLAVWKHLPDGRKTKDIDFVVNIDRAPNSVRERLLTLPDSPFIQHAETFHYQSSKGFVQIDILPCWQTPYMPPGAAKLGTLPAGRVPYIAITDLICFKINSCGMQPGPEKKEVDAKDAQKLLERFERPLDLTKEQQVAVQQGIQGVVEHSGWPEAWWIERLGLPTSK